ncbi:MAG TPA: 3'-5' exonuclease [Methylophilaceae bacterium]|nr:3'-5' exonuclease [Methylophilaceae bacterium]
MADLFALVSNDKNSTVMQLMYQEDRLSSLSEDGRQRVLHVRDILNQALQHQGRQTVSRWLYSVWLLLGGADCLWDAADVRDVQAFFSRIEALESAGQFSPQLLAAEVEKLYAAPDADADDRLQFMTIHKSKGLEFDTVILPGLDRKTGGNEQPLLLWEEVMLEEAEDAVDKISLVTAPYIPRGHTQLTNEVTAYDYLKMLEKERTAFEDARVLYVAATRAERSLHLLGAAKTDVKGQTKAPKNTFLDVLWPIIHPSFDDEHVIKTTITQTAQPSTQLADFVPQLIRLSKPVSPIKMPSNHQSNDFEGNNINIAEDKSTLDADIGILTHLYLQLIAEEGLENWSAARIEALNAAIQRWFKRENYETAAIATGVERVIRLLITTIESDQGKWVLASKTTAANELAIESLTENAVSKKVIDRTFVEDNIRWIIDYKTIDIDPHTTDEALKILAAKYQSQLDAYEKLFAHEGLAIKKAIFFVSLGRLLTF